MRDPAPSNSSPTNPCCGAPWSFNIAPAASPTAGVGPVKSIRLSTFIPARATSGFASTSRRPSTRRSAPRLTPVARSIRGSIKSRNRTSRPSWSRNRRSWPARAAPTRRALRRDGTVLCLCREGLRAGPTILHPDRLPAPAPDSHRRGLRQRFDPLRHPPRQPQRAGAGPAYPRGCGVSWEPVSPAPTPSAAFMP